MITRHSMARAALTALAMLAVAGCSLLSPANIETRKALLSEMPPVPAQRKATAATLLVFPPETKSVYDTTQMAYMTQPYQVAYYTRHEWGATPSQMLQPLLVKTLENTRYFSAVLTPPYSGTYTYALRTQILELVQDFTAEPPTLQLSLRLQLSDDASGRVLATREISLREPLRQKTSDAGVEAANDAAARALQEAAKFVLENAH